AAWHPNFERKKKEQGCAHASIGGSDEFLCDCADHSADKGERYQRENAASCRHIAYHVPQNSNKVKRQRWIVGYLQARRGPVRRSQMSRHLVPVRVPPFIIGDLQVGAAAKEEGPTGAD